MSRAEPILQNPKIFFLNTIGVSAEGKWLWGSPRTIQGTEPKLIEGKISSLSGVQDDPRYFQISVAVQPANSGGVQVNCKCNMVGVIAAKLSEIAALATSGSTCKRQPCRQKLLRSVAAGIRAWGVSKTQRAKHKRAQA